MAEVVAAADKLSGATLPPSGNTLPLRGLKMAVAEAVAAAGDPTGHRKKLISECTVCVLTVSN